MNKTDDELLKYYVYGIKPNKQMMTREGPGQNMSLANWMLPACPTL